VTSDKKRGLKLPHHEHISFACRVLFVVCCPYASKAPHFALGLGSAAGCCHSWAIREGVDDPAGVMGGEGEWQE